MNVRLTPSGGLVLLVAAGLAAAGRAFGQWGLLMGSATLGITVAAMTAWAVIANRPLTVERLLASRRVPEDRPVEASLVVTNAGRRTRRAGTVTDAVAGQALAVAVPPIRPGATVTVEHTLPGLPRGRYPLGPLTIDATDPFGLVRSRRTTGEGAVLRVHPRIHQVRLAEARHGQRAGLRMRWVPPDAIELHHLDEYHRGDDSRLIHWPTSLRRGALMVRYPANDRDDTEAAVLLDTARGSYLDDDQFEHAVRTAASLALALVDERGLIRFGTTGGHRTPVAAGRHRFELLDELTGLVRDASAPGLGDLRNSGERTTVLVAVTGTSAARSAAGDEDLTVRLGRLADSVVLLRLGPATRSTRRRSRQGPFALVEAPTSSELVDVWNAAAPL